jgi:FkbM family methyltransferase
MPFWRIAMMEGYPFTVFDNERWTLQLCDKLIQRNWTCIDVRAGRFHPYTWLFSSKAIDGVVMAYEPHPHVWQELLKNTEGWPKPKHFHLRNLGLSNRQFKGRFFAWGCWTLLPEGHEYYAKNDKREIFEVQFTTLDDEIDQYKLDRVDLIKIDADGAEEYIIKGAQEIINIFNPYFMLELSPACAEAVGSRTASMAEFLIDRGYTFYIGNGIVSTDPEGVENSAPYGSTASINAFAVPLVCKAEFEKALGK